MNDSLFSWFAVALLMNYGLVKAGVRYVRTNNQYKRENEKYWGR